jgi:hypothetical protein
MLRRVNKYYPVFTKYNTENAEEKQDGEKRMTSRAGSL